MFDNGREGQYHPIMIYAEEHTTVLSTSDKHFAYCPDCDWHGAIWDAEISARVEARTHDIEHHGKEVTLPTPEQAIRYIDRNYS